MKLSFPENAGGLELSCVAGSEPFQFDPEIPTLSGIGGLKCQVKLMGDSNPNPASRVFDLAELFVQFRYRAEQFWYNDENDEFGYTGQVLQILARYKESVKVLATEISKMPESQSAAAELTIFTEIVERFSRIYQEQWTGITRVKMLTETRNIDLEQEWDRDRYLLKRSPMQNGLWAEVQAAMSAVVDKLDPALKACFEIGELLAAETYYPTFAGGQRSRSDDDELAYLATVFSPRVAQAMTVMAEHFPFLGQLRLDLSRGDSHSVLQEIDEFRRGIGALLKDPAKAPGYLGLILDQKGGRVGRNGKWRDMTGPIMWEVLKRIERYGSEICPRKELEMAWRKIGHGTPYTTPIERVVSDLRKILHPLGIDIKCERSMGYRLIEHKRKRKSRPKKRRRA